MRRLKFTLQSSHLEIVMPDEDVGKFLITARIKRNSNE